MSTGDAQNAASSASEKNRREGMPRVRQASLGALCSAVVWGGAVAVGTVGIVYPHNYHVAAAAKKERPPVELIKIELTNDPLDEADATLPADAADSDLALPIDIPNEPEPPAPPDLPDLAALPQAIPVAAPETVTFALPIAGPVEIVEAPKAVYAAPPPEPEKPVEAVTPDPPPVTRPVRTDNHVTSNSANADAQPPVTRAAPRAPTRLTFGRGAGRQPAPFYPPQAIRREQTGTIRIRFTVAENGRVTDAEAVQPCEWPLLNNAALSTVRNRWRFPAGQERVYEVDIRFELK